MICRSGQKLLAAKGGGRGASTFGRRRLSFRVWVVWVAVGGAAAGGATLARTIMVIMLPDMAISAPIPAFSAG